jgi:hypothetical protein
MILRVATSVDGRAVTRQLAASEGPVPKHGSAGGKRACTQASDSRVEASNVCMDGCTPGLSDGPRGNRTRPNARKVGVPSRERARAAKRRRRDATAFLFGPLNDGFFHAHVHRSPRARSTPPGSWTSQRRFFHAHVHRSVR